MIAGTISRGFCANYSPPEYVMNNSPARSIALISLLSTVCAIALPAQAESGFNLKKLVESKIPDQAQPTDLIELQFASLSSNGTIVFAARTKGLTQELPPTQARISGQETLYDSGIYRRETSGAIATIIAKTNSNLQENLGPGGRSGSQKNCVFQAPAVSAGNTASISTCNTSLEYNGRTLSSYSGTGLEAQINGEVKTIASGFVTRGASMPSPQTASISGNVVAFDQSGSVRLSGAPMVNLATGSRPRISGDNLLFLTLDSGFVARLGGQIKTLKTDYGKPSPDNQGTLRSSCGHDIDRAQIAYCLQSDSFSQAKPTYSAIYRYQNDRSIKLLDSEAIYKPESRKLGSFDSLVMSGQNIAFLEQARGTAVRSLFLKLGQGELRKVISEGSNVGGKTVQTVSVGSNYLLGRKVVFTLLFTDGSRAIYQAVPKN
jgi:hypothetical protein